MTTITQIICDIEDCDETAAHRQKVVSVAFQTDQTEGKYTTPYLSGERLDFCEDHYQRYIDTLPVVAAGAQGYNKFKFKS